MTDPLLILDGLNVSLNLKQGPQMILQDISLELHRGEVLALVGESGSGKSMTSLAIMGLLPSDMRATGTIRLGELDLHHFSEQQMQDVRGRRIAMIFQEPQSSLNPVMTVGEQIGEALDRHLRLDASQRQARILELLEQVRIPDSAQRQHWYPHQLSGGQKQRVMIAMALACEPELLIADEPTTALDVTIQAEILKLLLDIRQQRQLAILFISHDLAVVKQVADRVAVMKAGQIVEQDATDKLLTSPSHAYTRQLVNAARGSHEWREPVSKPVLLEAEAIRVWFPQRKGLLQRIVDYTRAVTDVSLHIREGETVALVGESGSGKTTLGRALLRLGIRPQGQIRFRGQILSELSPRDMRTLRRDIQVIFQDPFASLNPRMTIGEIILEGMNTLKVGDRQQRQKTVIELLEKVGLTADHQHRYPHQFSGGQRQRIAIARALAVRPRLIVCDEPTSALDVSVRSQILDLLLQLQRDEGLSYLFITHDISLVPRMAHRVAVMQNGAIVESGDARQVLEQPSHPYTRTLLASVPRLD